MKAKLERHSAAQYAYVAWRLAKRSTRVAEWFWNVAIALLVMAATSGSLLFVCATLLVAMGATRHRTKVERINGIKEEKL